MIDPELPRLRPLDIRPLSHDGRPAYLLRDPLQIGERALLVPEALAPALALCDGTNGAEQIQALYRLRFGAHLSRDVIEDLFAALDEALMLDNRRFDEARALALEAYRRAPHRPMSHSDGVYPADPVELRAMIAGYLADAEGVTPLESGGRGVFSPHIDYARGGHVYAAVWKRAATMIREADLVVLLATDHYGEEGSLTLTRQHYATPLGVLPTAIGVVDALAVAIGEERAFAGELRNRAEHSVELVAVWLHALRNGRPVELVPVLCGSFGGFVRSEADPAEHADMNALLGALPEATAGRSVVYVVSGDLSHVGPAFGGQPLKAAQKRRVRAADEELIGRMCAGDADGFLDALRRAGDRNNVCGLPPGYLALRALHDARGHLVAYDQCPADEQETSLVSVCGVVFE